MRATPGLTPRSAHNRKLWKNRQMKTDKHKGKVTKITWARSNNGLWWLVFLSCCVCVWFTLHWTEAPSFAFIVARGGWAPQKMVLTPLSSTLRVPLVVVFKRKGTRHSMCIPQQSVDICKQNMPSFTWGQKYLVQTRHTGSFGLFTFIWIWAGTFSGSVVPLPLMVNVFLYRH